MFALREKKRWENEIKWCISKEKSQEKTSAKKKRGRRQTKLPSSFPSRKHSRILESPDRLQILHERIRSQVQESFNDFL